VKALVVSDIHGNIEALRAVEAAEPEADQVLRLGDLVDYGPRPDATVAWVRENATTTVRGNHDPFLSTCVRQVPPRSFV
jgi:predicted phosphodiesterase